MKSQRFQAYGSALVVATLLLFSVASKAQQISSAVGLIKGKVTTRDGKPAQGVNVWIIKGTDRVNTTRTTPEGTFTSVVQPNAVYRIAFSGNEYGYHEDTISIPALTAYREFTTSTTLYAIHNGESFALDNPVFLPGSSIIESKASAQLAEIIDMLRHNAKLNVNVTVYPDQPISGKKTDKTSTAQQKLADSRATAVRSYFMAHNVPMKNVNISTSTIVPAGRFAATQSAPAAEGSKKKKKAPEAVKPGLFPQYVEIVAKLAS